MSEAKAPIETVRLNDLDEWLHEHDGKLVSLTWEQHGHRLKLDGEWAKLPLDFSPNLCDNEGAEGQHE